MIVLVDGHNALHALGVDAGTHEADRGALLAKVREIVRARRDDAVIFFDGHPEAGAFGSTTHRGGIRTVFSGSREADDLIVDEVRACDQPGRMLVVTDDLEVSRRVRQLGAKTSGVAEFFAASKGGARREADEKPEGAGGFKPSDFGFDDDATFQV